MSIPTGPDLQRKWQYIKAGVANLKLMCGEVASAASLTRVKVLKYIDVLGSRKPEIDTLIANASTNGLQDWARTAENDETLVLATEWATTKTKIEDIQEWAVNNFPNDGEGGLITLTFNAESMTQGIDLTAGQLTAFKAKFAALDATLS